MGVQWALNLLAFVSVQPHGAFLVANAPRMSKPTDLLSQLVSTGMSAHITPSPTSDRPSKAHPSPPSPGPPPTNPSNSLLVLCIALPLPRGFLRAHDINWSNDTRTCPCLNRHLTSSAACSRTTDAARSAGRRRATRCVCNKLSS